MIWLRQNWFVAALPLAVALAWVLPEAGATGGWLRTEITTKIGVAVIFLFQGMTLAADALHAGARQWRLHVIVQGFTFAGFPLLGIALDEALGRWVSADLRLGFLFLCVLPSTISSSVVMTAMAGGNTAGAIFNAVASSLIGVFLTPLWIAWLMKSTGQSIALGPVVLEIVLLLLVPFFAGQVLRRWVWSWADFRKRRLGNASSGIILFIVFAAFSNSVQSRVWSEHGSSLVLAALVGTIIVFGLALVLVGLLAKAGRLTEGDRIAALFCAAQKTLASGVPMAKIIFGAHPALGVILLPTMLYHPLQLLVHGLMASRFAQQRARLGR
jgi:solute carrier family 10 (sodium/bile acid cotransporter), member 7